METKPLSDVFNYSLSLRSIFDPFRELTAEQQATLMYFVGMLAKCTGKELLYMGSAGLDEDANMILPIIAMDTTPEQRKSFITSIPAKYKNDLIILFLISLCSIGMPKKTSISQEEFNLICSILGNANITPLEIARCTKAQGVLII